MIIGIVGEASVASALALMQQYHESCDGFEWRLDYLNDENLAQLLTTTFHWLKPIIFTLRATDNGGKFNGSEAQRLQILSHAATCQPDFIDLENTVSKTFIEEFKRQYPAIKIIRSYHNFHETPADLSAILHSMQLPSCISYKLVTTANSTLDILQVALWRQQHSSPYITAHCMGEVGQPSRIIGKILGNQFIYATLTATSVIAGCYTLHELITIFRIRDRNQATEIYALLGDPVAHSIGHIYHNQAFAEQQRNAVYLKLRVLPHEITDFFSRISALPFAGFSITTPLKSLMMPVTIALADQSIGGINTIRRRHKHFEACNTDGLGAIACLEQQTTINEQRWLILGTGATARAIIVAAQARSPQQITIVTRNKKTVAEFFAANHCQIIDYDELLSWSAQPHIIIDALPRNRTLSEAVTQKISALSETALRLLDVNYAHENSLFSAATAEQRVPGEAMFLAQAKLQQIYWAT